MTSSNETTQPLVKTVVIRHAPTPLVTTPGIPEMINDRYRVRRVLGRGGFGTVYLAQDEKIGRLVAIKQLFETFQCDPEMFERFLQEARIAGQLGHPNIITLFNIEESKQGSLMIMEYLGGGSLGDLLKKEPSIPLSTLTQIMLGVMRGLAAAHDIMVVHRDIKPENILFGIGGIPKITDFGIAHLPLNNGGSELLNQDRQKRTILGTPSFMAPEQIAAGAIDNRTDIYAAGALFYLLLTRKNPIPLEENMSIQQMRRLIEEHQPSDPRQFRPELPDALAELVMKMIAKDPSQRPPKCSGIKREIYRILTQHQLNQPQVEGEELPDALTSHLFWSNPSTILEDIIYLLLIDGKLSIPERIELNQRIEQLGLSEQQAHFIENRVRHRLNLPSLEHLQEFADYYLKLSHNNPQHALGEEETIALRQLQARLHIPDDEAETIKTQIKQDSSC